MTVRAAQEQFARTHAEATETAFRIVQEGLNNVIKHAGTRRIEVRVATVGKQLKVEIIDDGKGFDPETTPEGFGRCFLQERCEALGGTLSVESTPGKGTRLRAFRPLEKGES